jgi:hypothetical protein
MRPASRPPRPLVLAAGHWLLIVVGVTVVLLFFLLIVAESQWRYAHVTEVRGPRLQRCLGFTAERRSMPGGEWTLLTITGVTPDSPLAAAGVGIDDVPVGYQHGIETGFYGDLEQVVAGHDAVVRVIARSAWHRGREAWRSVRIKGSARPCE